MSEAAPAGRLPAKQTAQTRNGPLRYIVSGQGAPTIVLFNGAGITLQGWRHLYPEIEALGTVFAWNRFGAGGSGRPVKPQTGAAVLASLRELLAHAGLQPPYVLVGHSMGGLYANLFARTYPQETAALLLLEATHPRDRAMLKGHEEQLAKVLQKLMSAPQHRFRANLRAELSQIDNIARELAAAPPFPDVPLTVVTGGKAPPKWLMPPAALLNKLDNQRALAALSPQGRQVIAEHSGHFPQLSEPGLVFQELARLLASSAA